MDVPTLGTFLSPILTPPPPSVTLLCPRPYALVSHFALSPLPPLCVTSFMNDPLPHCKMHLINNMVWKPKVNDSSPPLLKVVPILNHHFAKRYILVREQNC